jgi:uncharacterized coiled-coil protein SlyX
MTAKLKQLTQERINHLEMLVSQEQEAIERFEGYIRDKKDKISKYTLEVAELEQSISSLQG